MRIPTCAVGLVLTAASISTLTVTTAHAKRPLKAPVHPDTLPTLFQKWRLPASLAPYTTNVYAPRMVQSGKLLYVYDHHGRRIVAVKASNGRVVWHKPVSSRSDRAFAFTPLVFRDRVFVACDGFLYSFDAKNGDLKWRLGIKGVGINGLARSKHRIYIPLVRVAGGRALPGINLWAVDSRRARVEWTKKFASDKMAYVSGDADGVYYVGLGGAVLGLTSDRGDYKWQVRIKGKVMSAPILKSGRLYITSRMRKAGWTGTGVTVLDVKKGKVLWQTKLSSTKVSKFLFDRQLAVVEGDGQMTVFGVDGKKSFTLDLNFVDEPRSMEGVAVGKRAFIFSNHQDGHGYVHLVDLERRRVLAAANALDHRVHSMVSSAKMLFFDGVDGFVYAYRLDKSRRPRRGSVPPDEFARELLDRTQRAKAPIKGLAYKLAGLGVKALPAIEPRLQSSNPFVAEVAARAIGLIGSRRSVPALIRAVRQAETTRPRRGKADPMIPMIEALADMREGRAVGVLQRVMRDGSQSHHRRRAAYVALGAIGTPVALAPIWKLRAAKAVTTRRWKPQPFTPSFAYKVERDVAWSIDRWPEKVRRRTSITVQAKDGKVYTATLSPYLGGYNDIWVGQSDLSGVISAPLFTGLTKPEVAPKRYIRLKRLRVTKGDFQVEIQIKRGKRWIGVKPVTVSRRALAADFDEDNLSDLVERRLHLCVTNADCDGDGLKDSEDVNPLASSKRKPTLEQILFREAFFAYFSFLKRRGLVVVDPGSGPSFELYGRSDPVLSLRRPTIERLRKEVGLNAIDYVSFGGPYPEGGGSGDAFPKVVWNKRKTVATIGMDIFRSGENAVAYNVTLKKAGKNWVVSRFHRVWSTR